MSKYRERAAKEIREERPSATVTPIMRKLVSDSSRMLARGPQDARERGDDPQRVARIRNQRRQVGADAQLLLGRGEQHDLASGLDIIVAPPAGTCTDERWTRRAQRAQSLLSCRDAGQDASRCSAHARAAPPARYLDCPS